MDAIQTKENVSPAPPVLVHLILWFYLLGALSIIWLFARAFVAGRFPRQPAAMFIAVCMVVLAGVKLWGAFELRRLHRRAVSIFLLALLANLPLTFYDISRHRSGYRVESAWSMLIGLGVAIGVCLYCVLLERRGVLTQHGQIDRLG